MQCECLEPLEPQDVRMVQSYTPTLWEAILTCTGCGKRRYSFLDTDSFVEFEEDDEELDYED